MLLKKPQLQISRRLIKWWESCSRSYYKRTKEDIKKNYKKYTIDVDKSEVGNSPGFKNDLMLLKRFSKKIEEHGCKK